MAKKKQLPITALTQTSTSASVGKPVKRGIKVISGGQEGADRIGLEMAQKYGYETGGWAPAGFKTNLGPKPELGSKFGLKTTESPDYGPRTEHNVRESDLTLLYTNRSRRTSAGATLTRRKAFQFGKTVLENPSAQEVADAVKALKPKVVNIAGNREFSESRLIEKGIRALHGDIDKPNLQDWQKKGVVDLTGKKYSDLVTIEQKQQFIKYKDAQGNTKSIPARKVKTTTTTEGTGKNKETIVTAVTNKEGKVVTERDLKIVETPTKTNDLIQIIGGEVKYQPELQYLMESFEDWVTDKAIKQDLLENVVRGGKELKPISFKSAEVETAQTLLSGHPGSKVYPAKRGEHREQYQVGNKYKTDLKGSQIISASDEVISELNRIVEQSFKGDVTFKFSPKHTPVKVTGDTARQIIFKKFVGKLQQLGMSDKPGKARSNLKIDTEFSKGWIQKASGASSFLHDKVKLGEEGFFLDYDIESPEGDKSWKQRADTIPDYLTKKKPVIKGEVVSTQQAVTSGGHVEGLTVDPEDLKPLTSKFGLQPTSAEKIWDLYTKEGEKLNLGDVGVEEVQEIDPKNIKISVTGAEHEFRTQELWDLTKEHVEDLLSDKSSTREGWYQKAIFKRKQLISQAQMRYQDMTPQFVAKLDEMISAYHPVENIYYDKNAPPKETLLTGKPSHTKTEQELIEDMLPDYYARLADQKFTDSFKGRSRDLTSHSEHAMDGVELDTKNIPSIKNEALGPSQRVRNQPSKKPGYLPMHFSYDAPRWSREGSQLTMKEQLNKYPTTFDEIFKEGGKRTSTLRKAGLAKTLKVGDILIAEGGSDESGIRPTGEIVVTERWQSRWDKKTNQITLRNFDTNKTYTLDPDDFFKRLSQTERHSPEFLKEYHGQGVWKDIIRYKPRAKQKLPVPTATTKPVSSVTAEAVKRRGQRKTTEAKEGTVIHIRDGKRIKGPKITTERKTSTILSQYHTQGGVSSDANIERGTELVPLDRKEVIEKEIIGIREEPKPKLIIPKPIKMGLATILSFPFLDYALAPLDVAHAYETQIKPTQKEFNVGKTGFEKASGFMMPRSRDYEKSMREGKREVTALTEFKNWEEWDVVKAFSAWAKNRSETARSLRR